MQSLTCVQKNGREGLFWFCLSFVMPYPDIKQASSVRFVADQLMRNRNGCIHSETSLLL